MFRQYLQDIFPKYSNCLTKRHHIGIIYYEIRFMERNDTMSTPIEGKYLIYKGKPLVREKNIICYGDMSEKCYLFLMILTNKKENGIEVPDRILIQILSTDEKQRIIKQGEKSGLYNALDIGMVWLERALATE